MKTSKEWRAVWAEMMERDELYTHLLGKFVQMVQADALREAAEMYDGYAQASVQEEFEGEAIIRWLELGKQAEALGKMADELGGPDADTK